MPVGSRNVVKNVFKGVIAAKKEDEHYDPDKGTRSRKELKCLINDDSVEAKLIADTLQRELSVTHATVLVNELRKIHDLKTVAHFLSECRQLLSNILQRLVSALELP